MMKDTNAMICEKKDDILPDITEITEKAEDVCPVDWARRVIDTARRESCGRCVMCREGTIQVHRIISDLASGRGESQDIELLQDLCGVIQETASCQMARTAAGLVLASMENHAEEWDIHLKRKRCSALVCPAYFSVHILPDTCKAEGVCVGKCPESAILGGSGEIHVIDQDTCTRCGLCLDVCPHNAIVKAGAVKPKTPEGPVPVGSFESASRRRRRRRSAD